MQINVHKRNAATKCKNIVTKIKQSEKMKHSKWKHPLAESQKLRRNDLNTRSYERIFERTWKHFQKGQSSQKRGWIIDTQGLMNMTLWYRGTDDRNEEGQENHADIKKKRTKKSEEN